MKLAIGPLILLTTSLTAVFSANTNAADFRISPETDIKRLAKELAAGDNIILEDGTWLDTQLNFEQLQGTEDAPIRIRAETPGRTIISGRSQLRISGQNVIISGLMFRDAQGMSDVVEFRTHSERHAHRCRITDCLFEESDDANPSTESHWLSIYGSENRVDHCTFRGKTNKGTTLVVWVTDTPGRHRIDHNYFGRRPALGANGVETVRIGTSDVSEFDSQTIVEQNYFHECDGEAEIISNKSCGNIYRYNMFEKCSGALTLRHGHRCTVDSNAFLGRLKTGSGGVRIVGQSHKVVNNYFEGLRGNAERAALSIMNGIPDSPLNGYAPVRNAQVMHNTFVDCKVSVEIGVGSSKKQSAAPTDCTISHNVFLPDKWEISRIHTDLTNFDCHDNKCQIGGRKTEAKMDIQQLDLLFTRAADGLQRPTHLSAISSQSVSGVMEDIDGIARPTLPSCGCDEPGNEFRDWPDHTNTGTSWTIE